MGLSSSPTTLSTPHVDVQISRSATSVTLGVKLTLSSSMQDHASPVSPIPGAGARAIIRFRDRSSPPSRFRLLAIYHNRKQKDGLTGSAVGPNRIRLRCMLWYLCITGTIYGITAPKMPLKDPLPEIAEAGNPA